MDFVIGIGKFLMVLLEVILIFNLMIVVHEYGHFLAARWRGLKIEKFQIWFGKPIWKKEINGVQWGLGTIPAGGFVALPQMAPMEMLEGKTDKDGKEYPAIKPLDKIIVAFAGPLFSFGLAFVFAIMVFFVGKPVSSSSTTKVVGWVFPGKPAGAEGGLQVGDEILSVNGYEVRGFFGPVDAVMERIVHSRGEKIEFEVLRDGEKVKVTTGYELTESEPGRRRGFRHVGILPREKVVVLNLFKNSPAMRAGMQKGDVITHVDDVPVLSAQAIVHRVQEHPDKELKLTVLRGEKDDTEKLDFTMTPEKPVKPSDAKVGIGMAFANPEISLKHGISPMSQLTDSMTVMYRTLSSIFSSESDLGPSQMSGPLGIGNFYYQALSDPDLGWRWALWFSVLLNVNLALLNLLPFPVLDGGHITLATLEGVRRKPVNFRFLEYIQAACALLLIGFMLFVTWFDGGDIFGGGRKKKSEPPEFAEPGAASAPASAPAEGD